MGFDGPKNKVMRIGQDLRARALFWLVVVLIYQVLEQRSRTRRLRSRMFEFDRGSTGRVSFLSAVKAFTENTQLRRARVLSTSYRRSLLASPDLAAEK